MKRTRYVLLTLLAALMCVVVKGQERNVLRVPDVTVQIGQVQLPVAIENTDEIVAAQFDLTLPTGLTAGTEAVTTNRCDGHTVIIRNMGATRYRVMLYSDSNRPLLGQQGTVLNIPLTVPQNFVEGSEHQLTISNATLSVASGANVLTEATAGKLTISKLPDLTVKNIVAVGGNLTIIPGEHLSLSWQVENVGGLATGAGWSEQIMMVNKRGTYTKLIGTVYYQEPLEAGGVVSRQTDLQVPLLFGIEGEAYLQVRIVTNKETGESTSAAGNNMLQAAEVFSVEKKLLVEPSLMRLVEGTTSRVNVKVSRSGDWGGEQTFSLSATNDSRISLPAQVTIPAGQSAASVYMTVANNTVLDNDSIVIVTATGNGYPEATARLVIEDNEYPDLQLTSSKSVVTEGETFQLTVTTTRISEQPIVVTLTSETAKRFSFPQTVTIPAGETSATVDVLAIDDEVPSLELSNAFTASAPKYNKAEAIVLLQDNDLPVLQLTLTPTTVSESAGVVAVAAVLRRTTNTNSKITVRLSDDADGGLYYGNKQMVLDKGVEEVHFNLGPVDNVQMEGDRTYTITAAVWLSSCSCSAAGESAGVVQAQLTVLDNDGPALNLTSSVSTVKEGGKTNFVITRNNTASTPLTVTLSSDHDESLTYNHTVTIPAGQASATVEVTTTSNDIQGDSRTIVFTAQAEGYSTGTCFIMVTDQTLPDARINSIVADKQETEVGQKVTLTIDVTNEGAADLPAEIAVKIYRRGDNNAVATIYTSEVIPVGGSQQLTRTVSLPTNVGTYRYYAVVNESNKVQELLFNNNTSIDVVVEAVSPFSVTLSTDKTIYNQGEKILISGQVTGSIVSEADVDIYLINEGVRQVQKIKTDVNGNFTYEWELYALQSGHFVAGACYPNEGLRTEMATFDVYGLRRTEYSNITCDVINGDTRTGSLNLINPGVLDLTECSVEVLSVPDNCEASLNLPTTIAGGRTVKLSYSLKGTAPTAENKWDEVKARVYTREGVTLDITLYFYCRNAQGKLVASTNNIVTTMTKGKAREYSIQVTNIGHGNTGKIILSLPDFIKSLAGNTLPSLNQNDTLTIPLSFNSAEIMQLNVPINGQIGINCENGDGVAVNYSITQVSDEKGTLLIDVCDEYTYYTSEAPHVENATITLRNPITNAFVATGMTGKDGTFSVDLPEGYYSLMVTSPNHDSYQNNILVNPGKENRLLINLSIQAIKIDWQVEETEIEDEYEIVTTVNYETNVPMPVVVVDVPQSIPADELAIGESLIFVAIATNKGLIEAKGFTIEMPDDIDHLLFEPLIDCQDLTLAANQSITIPIRVTRILSNNNDRAEIRRKIDVMNILRCIASILPRYYWDCGPDRKWHRYKTSFKIGECKIGDPDIVKVVISTPPPIVIGDPVPNGGTGYSGSWSNDTIRTMKYEGCEPCQNRTLLTTIDCGLSLISRYKQLKGVINCAISAIETAEVLADKNKLPRHKLAAFLGTLVICKNAIATGKGDKNKTRQEQREQAIETLIDLLADITSKIGQDDFDAVTDWDNIVDMIGSVASIVKDLAGFNYDDIEELVCPLKLLRPCDYDDDDLFEEGDKHGSSKTQRRAKMSYPSYLAGYRHAVSYGALDMIAFTGLRKEFFGDINWLDCDGQQLDTFIQTFLLAQDENGIVADDMLVELEAVLPEDIAVADMRKLVERWNNTILNNDSENKMDLDKSILFSNVIEVVEERIHSDGYLDLSECISTEYEKALSQLNEANSSVCATISLQLSQKMVLTRQAFRGTLTVYNGHEDIPMTGIKLYLKVVSEDGSIATSSEMEMYGESLTVFGGNVQDLHGGWTLEAKKTGVATFLFIPTVNAAPTEPKNYFFGGTLSYIDPFTGLEVTRELAPVMLSVNPTPELDLTYFMQRDVYGDDPLTLDVVEPMEPAEFALLINNKGNGDATNVRMVTQQPEIIENEKGLHIDFEIVSSQVNGADAALAFGQSIANDFGTIPAHSQMYAQWWLTSTLLGHFTDYKVEATHVTSYGNEDLSLLDQVTIHELIHSLEVSTDGNKLRGFMVNDITDAEDLPDMLYLTNGEVKPVAIVTSANGVKTSATEYRLTVVPSSDGWNYGSFMDPAHGLSTIKSVVRQSDGKEMPLQNFWQTDRTLRDGKDWLYENRIHFADEFATQSSETYILTFEPTPAILLDVASIEGIPEEGNIAVAPLENITVNFTKKVNPETFTEEDLTLAVQGVKQDVSGIGISSEDNKAFTLDMSACSELSNGYYTLTVQTADITDEEGFQGKSGKQVGWILFRGGLVQLLLKAYPENSGTVMRKPVESADARRHAPAAGGDNSAEYGSTVVLFAEPKEGYEFSNWTLNGVVVSNEPEYTTTALGDMDVVANFAKKRYRVEIGVDGDGGSTQGTATGIYEYGTEINVSAVPDEDYMFKGWTVDGEQVEGNAPTITALVKKPLDIKASFMQEYYRHSMTFARGWNWMSSYLNEPLALDVMANYVHRIVGQFDEIVNDPEYGLVGNMTEMTAGKAYKVEANTRFTNSFRGHLYDMDQKPISLHLGWNWIGYPCKESLAINSAIQNAEEGDYLVSQTGFAEFADGIWEGTLDALEPGAGYLYKSESDKNLMLAPVNNGSESRPMRVQSAAAVAEDVDIHRYPNTMNVTAKLYIDGAAQTDEDYHLYAMAGDELRGIGQYVGTNYYLTVYGDEPVDIAFVIESAKTGNTYVADKVLAFRDDVIGSRRQPYVIAINGTTGIRQMEDSDKPMTVYSLEGVLVSRDATIKTLRKLPKGVYIVNGRKCYVK